MFFRAQNRETSTIERRARVRRGKVSGVPLRMKGYLASNYNSKEGRGLPRTTPPLEANAAKPSWLVLTDKGGLTTSESADGDSFDAYEPGGY